MNFLDRIITAVNPSAGLARLRSRVAVTVLEDHLRKYDSASMGRRGKEWRGVGSTSANTELIGAAVTLRNRSRDLGRNNPYAKRAFNNIANNLVGKGIMPGIKAAGPQSRFKNNASILKEAWREWATSTSCDVEGLKTFYSIQHLAMKAVVESGECFIILRPSKEAKGAPLRLQLLEGDYLDESRELPADVRNGGGYVMQGIEFNADGSRKGYWMWNNHPGESRTMRGLTSSFVPAKDVIHVFLQERPGQIRGVPFLAPVMQRLKDFDEYEDAQLVRQKIAACFVAFIHDGSDPTPGTPSKTNSYGLERVEPGIIEHLDPGQQVTFGNPPPTENYAEYSTSILRGVAAGVGITYEGLTGDFSKVNFSSARLGWIEYQRQLEAWQTNMLIPILCHRVWDAFLAAMKVKTGNATLSASVSWTAPRREMIDPDKETKGMVSRMNGYMAGWEDIAREMGQDPDELFAMIEADKTRFEAAGLVPPTDVRLNQSPINQQQQNTE